MYVQEIIEFDLFESEEQQPRSNEHSLGFDQLENWVLPQDEARKVNVHEQPYSSNTLHSRCIKPQDSEEFVNFALLQQVLLRLKELLSTCDT